MRKTLDIFLYTWRYKQTKELQEQIKEADIINNPSNNSIPSTCLGSYEIASSLLEFNDLHKPKNSDDYYKQNDNIISNESLDRYCLIINTKRFI
jgi:hypothetical protein